MTDNNNNPWKIKPIIPNPEDLLDMKEEEDDEPTHTLLGPVDQIKAYGTCHLCGAKSVEGQYTGSLNQLYFICNSCRNVNAK